MVRRKVGMRFRLWEVQHLRTGTRRTRASVATNGLIDVLRGHSGAPGSGSFAPGNSSFGYRPRPTSRRAYREATNSITKKKMMMKGITNIHNMSVLLIGQQATRW
jgi:hypothetical protein